MTGPTPRHHDSAHNPGKRGGSKMRSNDRQFSCHETEIPRVFLILIGSESLICIVLWLHPA